MMNRKQLSASIEDYLETILEISPDNAGVRASQISRKMGVTRPSVTGALRLLKLRKLINYQPYIPVKLTPAGIEQAKRVARRHHDLYEFLNTVLQIPAESAETAACSMEHIIPESIADIFLAFTEFLATRPGMRKKLADGFRQFCEERNSDKS